MYEKHATGTAMNPIIVALQSHIDRGERPTNFCSAQVVNDTHYGIEIELAHQQPVIQHVCPRDQAEFLEWFQDAEVWWDPLTVPRQFPKSG